ncbi:MAG TPA: ABC transporter [Actinomadura sp.]|jgi:GTP-binding protein EngB required for normal cell division|nr:ABC transporter [Actinomadura sp.]
MTTTVPSASHSSAAQRATDGSGLSGRLNGLARLVELGTGRIDGELIEETTALLERAGERLRLSGDHTVVTLAGGTGSGKSSLFNAICGLELSPVGVRRPMTSQTHACVWGLDGAGPLLDWLDVDKRHRYARASALDASGTFPRQGEAARPAGTLQGLVLLDLPDHDSIRAVHREEVDRFVTIADLLVWVVDPQKYADASLHRDYIVPFARHAGVTVIVLNQVDRLDPAEVDDCVSDLRRLLEAEGLQRPRIVATSTVTDGGIDELRDVLVETVSARHARTERLSVDLDTLVDRFARFRGDTEPPAGIDESRIIALIDALTDAAGAPAVAEVMESAYKLRALDYVGWPVARTVQRMRSDPLRKIRLTELRDEMRDAFSGPVGAQQGDVDNALQGVTDDVTAELPEAWSRSVRAAGRLHASHLPDALGASLRKALPTFNQVPRWWWLTKTWQYFLVLVTVLSLIWIVLLVVYGVLGVASAPIGLLDDAGLIPYITVLGLCTFGMGALTSSACRNVVAMSSAKHGGRMDEHMRERVAVVAREKVAEPVSAELEVYARYRAEVDALY